MKAVVRVVGASLLAIVLAGVWALWNYGRCLVKVTNSGSTILSDITVGLGDERHVVGELRQGQSTVFRFYPRGESGAELSARRPDGRFITSGSYVESSGGYRLHYVVDDSTTVRTAVGSMRFRSVTDDNHGFQNP